MPTRTADACLANAVRLRSASTAQSAIVTPRCVWLRWADAELVVRVFQPEEAGAESSEGTATPRTGGD